MFESPKSLLDRLLHLGGSHPRRTVWSWRVIALLLSLLGWLLNCLTKITLHPVEVQMSVHWYLARANKKYGPYSPSQLKEFAAAGWLGPADSVQREGMRNWVLASKVKGLFADTQANFFRPTTDPKTKAILVDGEAPIGYKLCSSSVQPERNPETSSALTSGRATAVSGAVIMSQDGENVHYRKKCTKCGHKDIYVSTMPIRNEVTKVSFFCPKCRKIRDVVIEVLHDGR